MKHPVLLLCGIATSIALVASRTEGMPLDPNVIPKFVSELVIPPAMPRTAVLPAPGGGMDYYEIAVRQITQQILPPVFPATTVFAYGSPRIPGLLTTRRSRSRRPTSGPFA